MTGMPIDVNRFQRVAQPGEQLDVGDLDGARLAGVRRPPRRWHCVRRRSWARRRPARQANSPFAVEDLEISGGMVVRPSSMPARVKRTIPVLRSTDSPLLGKEVEHVAWWVPDTAVLQNVHCSVVDLPDLRLRQTPQSFASFIARLSWAAAGGSVSRCALTRRSDSPVERGEVFQPEVALRSPTPAISLQDVRVVDLADVVLVAARVARRMEVTDQVDVPRMVAMRFPSMICMW